MQPPSQPEDVDFHDYIDMGAAEFPGDEDDSKRKATTELPHIPHYGLKRGMACTFCRRRKLRCTGDKPMCSNCVKYTKVCEYGPPVKESRQSRQSRQDSTKQPPPMTTQPPPQLQPTALYMAPPNDYEVSIPPPSLPPADFASSLFGSDFNQQSPFVSNVHPTVGMPPYIPPTGPGYDPFETNQWLGLQSYDVTLGPMDAYIDTGYDPVLAAQTTMSGVTNLVTPLSDLATPMADLPPPMPNLATTTPNYNSSTPSFTTSTPSFPNSTPAFTTSTSNYSSTSNITSNHTAPGTPRLPSDASTPDGHPSRSSSGSAPSSSMTSIPRVSNMYRQTASLHYVSDVDTVDGLTERLGEFLFSPDSSAVKEEDAWAKRSGGGNPSSSFSKSSSKKTSASSRRPEAPLTRMRVEYDGLVDASRSILLDCFLAHAPMFFELSVPRFRYRMTFSDRRRPSLALLNAMYLWATRMSNSPQMSNMESHFFEQACKHLEVSTSTVDRLIDGVRAAMLLSAYSHSSGRHHEGWIIAGMAIRLVLSCGLHRIKSCVLKPDEVKNPFLRNRVFLLPPPEDAVELGERIHAFWAVFAIDRCGALATGYPAGIRDEDITTPFARCLADIASGSVSERDDMTVRDLYRGVAGSADRDTDYTKWVKCVAILERAAKMSFLEPDEDSPYALAWNHYSLTLHRDPHQPPPPDHLNQPKYRNPHDYREGMLAVDQLITAMGDEGIFPVIRKMHAEQDGIPEPKITTQTIMLHHLVASIHMVLHDINSLDVENAEALKAARKSVLLFRVMPQIPFTDVDAFVVLVWSMIAKVLVKEVHRLSLIGDSEGARTAASEVDTVNAEMSRIGQTMHLARTQAKAMEELKLAAIGAGKGGPAVSTAYIVPQLQSFMFPNQM